MKIEWKLTIYLVCLLFLAACDTNPTLIEDSPEEAPPEEVPPEDNRLLPLGPSAKWIYENKRHGVQLTLTGTGQKREHRGQEYDVLSVAVEPDPNNHFNGSMLTRETDEGLNLVELRSGYHEFFFKYPVEIHEDSTYSKYTYSFEQADGSTFTRDAIVTKDSISVPAGDFECLRYIHRNHPELYIMQYCLVPGVGFVDFHYGFGTYLSQLVSFSPAIE